MSAYTFEHNEIVNVPIVLTTVIGQHSHEIVYGLIDTGCSHTCISEELAQKMNLTVVGSDNYIGADTIVKCNKYLVGIYIDQDIDCGTLDVGTFKKQNRPEDVLIGMDILNHCDLAITNTNGKTRISISCPSTHTIDFTKENML